MSETQQPKDLTAQLAAEVMEVWEARHSTGCYRRACEGDSVNCTVPKPAALVAYEQGQACYPCGCEMYQDCETCRPKPLQAHATALPNPLCACSICHDLRADGAGELQETAAAIASERTPEQWQAFRDAQPALAYVLTRERAGNETTVLRSYADKSRADDAAELLNEQWPTATYRVHSVPRVE